MAEKFIDVALESTSQEILANVNNLASDILEGIGSMTGAIAFTEDGTFVVPENVSVIKVCACAAGGELYAGEYCINKQFKVTPGEEIPIVVGDDKNTEIGEYITLLKAACTESVNSDTLGLGVNLGLAGNNGSAGTAGVTGHSQYGGCAGAGGAGGQGGYGGAFGFGGAGGGGGGGAGGYGNDGSNGGHGGSGGSGGPLTGSTVSNIYGDIEIFWSPSHPGGAGGNGGTTHDATSLLPGNPGDPGETGSLNNPGGEGGTGGDTPTNKSSGSAGGAGGGGGAGDAGGFGAGGGIGGEGGIGSENAINPSMTNKIEYNGNSGFKGSNGKGSPGLVIIKWGV